MPRKKNRQSGPALFEADEINPSRAFALGMVDRARASLRRQGWVQASNGSWVSPDGHDGRLTTYQNERIRAGRTIAYDPRLPLPERMRRFRDDFPQAYDRMLELKEAEEHGKTT